MLNIPYSTEHFSTDSLRPFTEVLRKSELKALGFKEIDSHEMIFRSKQYPNVRFVRLCDDIESTARASVEEDTFLLIEEDENMIVDEEL